MSFSAFSNGKMQKLVLQLEIALGIELALRTGLGLRTNNFGPLLTEVLMSPYKCNALILNQQLR